jgi:hypothetical protein
MLAESLMSKGSQPFAYPKLKILTRSDAAKIVDGQSYAALKR